MSGRFLEQEVYPLETAIVEANEIDPAALDELRRKARAEGFSQLNMPAALGGRDLPMLGQVALEEESGKATNGLGFAVVDRGRASSTRSRHPTRSSATCCPSCAASTARPGR